MRLVIFLSTVLFLIIYIFWKFIQLLPESPAFALISSFLAIFLSLAWLILARLKAGSTGKSWFQLLMWAGSSAMGFLGTWIFCSLPFDLMILFVRPRQDWVLKIAEVLFYGAILMTFIGFLQARRGPALKKIKLPSRQHSPDLDNFKIAQISDLHVGLTIRRKYVENVVEKTMAQRADMIVITGDLADGTPQALSDDLEPLKKLSARFGVYFITGNHEYYSGAESWIDFAKSCGFIPLLNENRVLNIGQSKLLISGVTDLSGGQFVKGHEPDYAQARGFESADFKILLAHQPEVYKRIQNLDFDLLMSGHTHAGQFFPFNLLVHFVHKFNRGLGQQGSLLIYVNQGTGYWGPAHRLFVPSEISVIEL